jgi:hypothetical protein
MCSLLISFRLEPRLFRIAGLTLSARRVRESRSRRRALLARLCIVADAGRVQFFLRGQARTDRRPAEPADPVARRRATHGTQRDRRDLAAHSLRRVDHLLRSTGAPLQATLHDLRDDDAGHTTERSILGGGRLSATPPAPTAASPYDFFPTASPHPSNSRSASDVTVTDVETLRTKRVLSCFLPGLETGARLRKAATPRHFRRQPGKSPFGGTGWWSWQDSNGQPDRLWAKLRHGRSREMRQLQALRNRLQSFAWQ